MKPTLLVAILVVAASCRKKVEPQEVAPAGSGSSVVSQPPVDAVVLTAPLDAAAAPAIDAVVNPYETELCVTLLTKVVECENDKDFIAALDANADVAKKKLNARIRKDFHDNVAGIHDPSDRCDFLSRIAAEHAGFMSHWDLLEAAPPEAFATCAALGALIAKADGLVGGHMSQ